MPANAIEELEAREGESVAELLNTDRPSLAAALASLPGACRRIAGQYATADGLALHYGAHTRSTWKRVTLGVMAAAVAFHLHAASFALHDDTPSSLVAGLATLPWFLIAFLVLSSFTATWVYGRAEKHEYQTKYQDYRALAEALRIQFFWRIAGVADPVVENYLRKQRQRTGVDTKRAQVVRRADDGAESAGARPAGPAAGASGLVTTMD